MRADFKVQKPAGAFSKTMNAFTIVRIESREILAENVLSPLFKNCKRRL